MSSVPFSVSSPGILIIHMLYFSNCLPLVWGLFCSFFFFLLFLIICLSTWEFSGGIYSRSLFLPSAVSSLLRAHQRHSSFLLLLISSISFWFFLRVSISLLTRPICSYMWSTFSFRAFNILIIVILASWLINSKTCHIWVWFCLFRLCALLFSMLFPFLILFYCCWKLGILC